MLGLTDPFAVFCGKSSQENPDEIDIDTEDSDESVVFEDQDEETSQQVEGPAPKEQVLHDPEETASHVSSLDTTTSSEVFPTFIHSMSANESMLNDSILSEAAAESAVPGSSQSLSQSHSTSAARQHSVMDTDTVPPPRVSGLSLPAPQNTEPSVTAAADTSSSPGELSRKRCSTEDAAVEVPVSKVCVHYLLAVEARFQNSFIQVLIVPETKTFTTALVC